MPGVLLWRGGVGLGAAEGKRFAYLAARIVSTVINTARKITARRPQIDGYEIYKIETPTGRVIGDNNCAYRVLDVVCVCLMTSDGYRAWGYGETCSRGTFAKEAWFIKPMKALAEVKEEFVQLWWPWLQNCSEIEAAILGAPKLEKKNMLSYLTVAVRMALWDLRAQQSGLPLWRLLGGKPERNQVRVYGSLLDFHLSESEAVAKVRDFSALGITSIKVKVGGPDLGRDVARLRLISQAAPVGAQITADANIAWTAAQTIRALQHFAAEGIELGYLEDPLPPDDVAGYRELAQARAKGEISTALVGHDYASTGIQLSRLLETGALSMVRNGNNLDHSITVARLARKHGVKMIFANSMFELNVHPAVAFGAEVDRLEFSDLKWNDLMQTPVRFAGGMAFAPQVAGHGLAPRLDLLVAWACPGSQ